MPGLEEKENSRERLAHNRISTRRFQAVCRREILVKETDWGLRGSWERGILFDTPGWQTQTHAPDYPGSLFGVQEAALWANRVECHTIEHRNTEVTHRQSSYLAFPSLGP